MVFALLLRAGDCKMMDSLNSFLYLLPCVFLYRNAILFILLTFQWILFFIQWIIYNPSLLSYFCCSDCSQFWPEVPSSQLLRPFGVAPLDFEHVLATARCLRRTFGLFLSPNLNLQGRFSEGLCFSKGLLFLLVGGVVFRNHGLGARCAHCHWGVPASRLFECPRYM